MTNRKVYIFQILEENMKRKGIIIGIVLGTLGLVGLINKIVSEEVEKSRVEARDIYIEKPVFVSEKVEGALDKLVGKIRDNDYAGFEHPQAGRVQTYRAINGTEKRVTKYIDTNRLGKILGRTPSGDVIVYEKKIGEDLWQFDGMDVGGPDITDEMIEDVRKKIPWIFEAWKQGKPYTLKTKKDNSGKVRKAIYLVQDGKTIELEDGNNNGLVDKITTKNH